MKKMKEDSRVVAITSGTPAVMGFTEDKRKEAGRQFIDVGIAEETAVALASGIAANGGKLFTACTVLLYSGHLTRLHRICVSTTVRQQL